MNMVLVFQRLIHFEVDSSTLEMGASAKATSLSRVSVRNDALGDFWIACVRGSAETDSVEAGKGFTQRTALRHRLWQRLDSIPNAV